MAYAANRIRFRFFEIIARGEIKKGDLQAAIFIKQNKHKTYFLIMVKFTGGRGPSFILTGVNNSRNFVCEYELHYNNSYIRSK